jgi:deoxyribonuclease-1
MIPIHVLGEGNQTINSFNKAKRLLHTQVYTDYRETLYCSASYGDDKKVDHPEGFESPKYKKRAARIEWEHVVPAENFGRAFKEWRDGSPECKDSKGKPFKGRKCAEKVVMAYRYMQADLYNLYPAIGSVNALRSNYSFTMLPGEASDFGACPMRIENRKAEPPEGARGRIARTYQYMETTYPQFSMSKKTRQLMRAWDKMYPISEWECERARRIESIQGNQNPILASCYL